ncbi:MAG: DUF896 domain-containing protein [Clostridiaceae bacterium]|nr:DUF896 domain-containing protein [Clostridiaceae bacterium]
MKKSMIDRINELARKAKAEGLTDEEKLEQQMLREKYIADFKKGLISALESIVLVDAEGKLSKLEKRQFPEQ